MFDEKEFSSHIFFFFFLTDMHNIEKLPTQILSFVAVHKLTSHIFFDEQEFSPHILFLF